MRRARMSMHPTSFLLKPSGTAYPAAAYAGGRPWHGFIVARSDEATTAPSAMAWFVTLPYWALATLTAAPPVVLWARCRRRRPPAGICSRCGYDLRATPGRCPECGTPATAGG